MSKKTIGIIVGVLGLIAGLATAGMNLIKQVPVVEETKQSEDVKVEMVEDQVKVESQSSPDAGQ